MTTLHDRPEPDSLAGQPFDGAHCPHCGSLMATGVELPWPAEPVMCSSCHRWVGRARAVPGQGNGGPTAPDGNGAASSGQRARRGRPGSAERRRARAVAAGQGGGAAGVAALDAEPAEGAGPEASSADHDAPIVDAPEAHDGAGDEWHGDDGATVAAPGHAAHEAGEDGAFPDGVLAGEAPGADATEVAAPGEVEHGGAAPAEHPSFPSDPASTMPFAALVDEPEPRRRLRLPRLRRRSKEAPAPAPVATAPGAERPRRGKLLRVLPFLLLVIGLLLLVEGALTVLWKEPFSAFFAAQTQGGLDDKLEKLEREAAAQAAQGRKQMAQYQRRQALNLNRSTAPGEPLGRLRIPEIDLSTVIVQSTSEASLTKGPAHYTETPLPGAKGKWTVGIAGHRTTYDAPFRHINKLKRGDKIVFTLPYGRFTYSVSKTRIVDDSYTKAFVPQGKNMIALTACHPLYSAAQRILVFGTLSKTEPLGRAKRAAAKA